MAEVGGDARTSHRQPLLSTGENDGGHNHLHGERSACPGLNGPLLDPGWYPHIARGMPTHPNVCKGSPLSVPSMRGAWHPATSGRDVGPAEILLGRPAHSRGVVEGAALSPMAEPYGARPIGARLQKRIYPFRGANGCSNTRRAPSAAPALEPHHRVRAQRHDHDAGPNADAPRVPTDGGARWLPGHEHLDERRRLGVGQDGRVSDTREPRPDRVRRLTCRASTTSWGVTSRIAGG
jgi:hypothetical protein